MTNNDDRDRDNGDADDDDDGQVHERIGNVLLTGCEYCYRL